MTTLHEFALTWERQFEGTLQLTAEVLANCSQALAAQGVLAANELTPAVKLRFFDVAALIAGPSEPTELAQLLATKLAYEQQWPAPVVTGTAREWLLVALGKLAVATQPAGPLGAAPLTAATIAITWHAWPVKTEVRCRLTATAELSRRTWRGDELTVAETKTVTPLDAPALLAQLAAVVPAAVATSTRGPVADWVVTLQNAAGEQVIRGQSGAVVPAPLVTLSAQLRAAFSTPAWPWFDDPVHEPVQEVRLALHTSKPVARRRFVSYQETLTIGPATGRIVATRTVAQQPVGYHVVQFAPEELARVLAPLPWWQLPATRPDFDASVPPPIAVLITTPSRTEQRWVVPPAVPAEWAVIVKFLQARLGTQVLTGEPLVPLWFSWVEAGEEDVTKDDETFDDDGHILVVSVTFQSGGKAYDYLAGDLRPVVGDRVVVPVGPTARPQEVTVVAVRRVAPDVLATKGVHFKRLLGFADA